MYSWTSIIASLFLDFVLPQGPPGLLGEPGDQGSEGQKVSYNDEIILLKTVTMVFVPRAREKTDQLDRKDHRDQEENR